MATSSLHLDVVIDVVCPWCFLGKRRIDVAMAALPDIDFTVRYRPFQLDPGMPAEGVERTAYMLAKFKYQARIDEIHGQIEAQGREVDIAFAFDKIKVAPNTFDSHRLIRWASDVGQGDEMVERLFALYFEEGGNLSDRATLAAAAADVGFDAEEVAALLATDASRAEVQGELDHAANAGVSGVPFTIVASKYAISGAQPSALLANAFQQIAAEA